MPNGYRLLLPIVTVLLLVAASGCDSTDPELDELGSVRGQIVAADGTTPIPGATVTLYGAQLQHRPAQAALAVDAPQAVTDSQGRFLLENVPVGQQRLVARRGAFEAVFDATVQAGVTVEVPPAPADATEQFAYIAGHYDSIEDIVQIMGYDITRVTRHVFNSPEEAAQYGTIFLNCDTQLSTASASLDNARAWMQAGGTLYVSDISGLSANRLIEGFLTADDDTEEGAITAEIVLDDLRTHLGRDQIDITYDLGSWWRIAALPEEARVLLRGTRPGQTEPEPLAVVIPVGQGQLVFTSFHNTTGAPQDQLAVLRYFIFLPSGA